MVRSIFILIILWEITVWALSIPSYLLPAPHAIFSSFWKDALLLFSHTLLSLKEIVIGLLCGFLLALSSVYIAMIYRPFERFLRAFFIAIQSFPSFALIPVLSLWVGHGLSSKIIAVALSCFFPLASSLLDGLVHIPPKYRDLVTVFGKNTSYVKRLKHIYAPLALPTFLSGLRIAAVHAPVTVIAAEWISSTGGLGYLIMVSGGRLEMPLMFSCLFILGAMGYIFYFLIQCLEKRFVFWDT
jgi:putative hydroxymethylpyrimidine transport system permease protein